MITSVCGYKGVSLRSLVQDDVVCPDKQSWLIPSYRIVSYNQGQTLFIAPICCMDTSTATEEPTLIKNPLNKAPEENIGSESQQDALSDISLIQERYIDVSSDDDMETESDVAECND
ncbi:hypothetical protein BDB01DRAFT_839874 [Pilobolus umbonatus]|nr:hypothetical protein BDB01DRAFT_839874 [Pilobolus umbonatus]